MIGNRKINVICLLSAGFIILGFCFTCSKALALPVPDFQMKIVTICGNNVKEPGENCDGPDLNGFTCQDLGFGGGGSLSCSQSCTSFDTSACVFGTATSTVGSVSYTDNNIIISRTNAEFDGLAYPNRVVILLKDGQIAGTTTANALGAFRIDISNLSGGNYNFGVYSKDYQDNNSFLYTFPGLINSNAENRVSGIFIAPTISLNKSKVQKGDSVAISGQTASRADVLIYVDSTSTKEFTIDIKADTDGKYFYNLDTSKFDIGRYFVKTRANLNNETSSYNLVVNLDIGTEAVAAIPTPKCPAKADLNNDCRVNLTDFSIMAYWYGRTFTDAFTKTEKEKLNGDGRIDLTDFSIMAFYWTG